MANKISPPGPAARDFPGGGGEEPVIAKGPFFLFLLMMPVFILIILTLLLAMQYKQLRAFVSPQPMPMATVPESAESQAAAHAEVLGFFADSARDTLSLSTETFTHLSRVSKPLSDLGLDYHFELQDSVLVARNSLPSSTLRGFLSVIARITRVKGYLNSEMKGIPEFKAGKITIVPVGAVMNGVSAPVSVLGQNPIDVKDWVSDKDFYDKALAELSEVKVRNGLLLLIKRKRAS